MQIVVTNGVTLCNTIQLFHTTTFYEVLQQQGMGSADNRSTISNEMKSDLIKVIYCSLIKSHTLC